MHRNAGGGARRIRTVVVPFWAPQGMLMRALSRSSREKIDGKMFATLLETYHTDNKVKVLDDAKLSPI